MPQHSKLIVVANRLLASRTGKGPSARWERSPGGLVSAMEPVLAARGGVWIGWDGGAGPAPRPATVGALDLRAVGLSRSEVIE